MQRAHLTRRALKVIYTALKGITTFLSFAICPFFGVCGARGLRFNRLLVVGSRLGTLDDQPERPVQIAMKTTASSAAGRSHTGALSGLSVVAFRSAWSKANLAASASA